MLASSSTDLSSSISSLSTINSECSGTTKALEARARILEWLQESAEKANAFFPEAFTLSQWEEWLSERVHTIQMSTLTGVPISQIATKIVECEGLLLVSAHSHVAAYNMGLLITHILEQYDKSSGSKPDWLHSHGIKVSQSTVSRTTRYFELISRYKAFKLLFCAVKPWGSIARALSVVDQILESNEPLVKAFELIR